MIGQVRPSRDGKQLSLFTAEDEKVLIRSGSVVGPWLAQRKKKKGAVFAAILDELTRGDSGGLCTLRLAREGGLVDWMIVVVRGDLRINI